MGRRPRTLGGREGQTRGRRRCDRRTPRPESPRVITRWTLQQFTAIAGRPWYALQGRSGAGVERQYTGYAEELAELARHLGITPEVLPATTEADFFRRCAEE